MGFVPEMRKVIAEILEITLNDISVKATTTEKLGFIGKEEGIMAQAVVLLRKRD
jgi:2-C-methyl-D-erythritol 2,4-cyclodiphosphate synthase